MAVSDKKPMSRLMKLANKFNCFYLSGKWKRRVVLALFRLVSIDVFAGRMIDRNARLPSVRTTGNIDFECCVYLSLAFPFEMTSQIPKSRIARLLTASRVCFSHSSFHRRLLRASPEKQRFYNGLVLFLSRQSTFF